MKVFNKRIPLPYGFMVFFNCLGEICEDPGKKYIKGKGEKKMGKNFKKQWVMTVIMFALLVLVRPLPAQAANPTVQKLREGVTYLKYDITGDGRADRILIQNFQAGWWYDGVKISVNGKTAYQFSSESLPISSPAEATLYTLRNGKPFLYLFAWTEDDDGLSVLLQYRAGKLRNVVDFNGTFSGYGSHRTGKVLYVSGNRMTLGFTSMSWTLGYSQYNFSYVYRNGTMRLASSFGTVSRFGSGNVLVAGRSLKVYTDVTARRTAFLLKPGNRIVVTGVYCGKTGLWLRVYYGGKYGYLKCLSSAPMSGPIFSNVMYAG